MKILEAQNSVLSNHEVYELLVNQQTRQKGRRRRQPGNLATLVNEVLKYLRTAPSPFHDKDQSKTYDQTVVTRLLERLGEANLNQDLVKGEVLMILNLRPSSNAVLNAVIEDMEERFSDDEQNTILEIIAEVLGQDEPKGSGDAGHDENAMASVEHGA